MKDVDTVPYTQHAMPKRGSLSLFKRFFATLLDIPNHRCFLAAKLHKTSQIWHFCLAI